jgi:hypothetical protein
MVAPCEMNFSAMPLPIPREAPVMIAILPSKVFMGGERFVKRQN